jgi:hypothetical protein
VWPCVVVGIGYVLLGIAFIAYGLHRMRAVDTALRCRAYIAPVDRVVSILAAFGVLLGALKVSQLLYES